MRHQDLETTKQRIVSHVRKLVFQGDEVLRRVRLNPAVTLGSLHLDTSKYSFPLSLSHCRGPRTPCLLQTPPPIAGPIP